jgi:hypothetical protein
MKREWIIYPLLFALFPVLARYCASVTEVSPSQVVRRALDSRARYCRFC